MTIIICNNITLIQSYWITGRLLLTLNTTIININATEQSIVNINVPDDERGSVPKQDDVDMTLVCLIVFDRWICLRRTENEEKKRRGSKAYLVCVGCVVVCENERSLIKKWMINNDLLACWCIWCMTETNAFF